MPGRFITFEGGEGAGKTTQARLLVAALGHAGIDVVLTREPGGSPGAEEIRALLVTGEPGRWDPIAETLLHYAARREHIARVIEPALSAGQWVVSDRFADSTTAYQGAGQGVDPAFLASLQAHVLGALRPDLTLVLDIAPQVGLARAGRRGTAEDRYERMDLDFHQRLRSEFQVIAEAEPDRCAQIRASLSVDLVHAEIRRTVHTRLGASL